MRLELEVRDNNYFPARVLPQCLEFVRANRPLPLEVDDDLPILSRVELSPRVLNYEPTIASTPFVPELVRIARKVGPLGAQHRLQRDFVLEESGNVP